MSNGLINESPLLVFRSLAVKIGLNESILLQQVHFWILQTQERHEEKKFFEDRWWVYNSIPQWREHNFPFWSERTIQRIIKNLMGKGLLIRKEQVNDDAPGGVQIWYSIDYAVLEQANMGGGDNLSPGCGQVVTTFTENTTKTTKDSSGAKKQRQSAPRKPRQPDPWIDTIAEHVFNAQPGTPQVSAIAGRAAQIKKWCMGQDVKIGPRTIDGCDLPVTPADIQAWATEWRAGKRIGVPQGLERFVQYFYEWRRVVEDNRRREAKHKDEELDDSLLRALKVNMEARGLTYHE